MDKEYREGLGSNTSAIDEQVDYLISKGLTKEEDVGFILESVNSEKLLMPLFLTTLMQDSARRMPKGMRRVFRTLCPHTLAGTKRLNRRLKINWLKA